MKMETLAKQEITAEQKEWLRAEAERLDRSISYVVRMVLQEKVNGSIQYVPQQK